MDATIIHYTFKDGQQEEALASFEQSLDEPNERVEGLRGALVLDHSVNKGTGIAVYESKENWQAAAPVAQEFLGKWAPFFVELPERGGYDLVLAKRYVTD